MAQTGYTPLQIYSSSTSGNIPSASNLAQGELAINVADGKLFYKTSGGAVAVIANAGVSTGNLPGGSTGSVVYQSATGVTAYLTLGSAGSILYSNGTGPAYAALGTSGYILTSNGTAPTYVSPASLTVGSATTATTATNIASGAANQLVYQSGSGATTFVTAPSTLGTVLGWNGSTFAWVSAPAATSATNIAGGLQYQIPFQSAPGTTTFSSGLTFNSSTSTLTATNITATTALSGSTLTVSAAITSASNKGAINYGTLNFTDTNIVASYQTSVNSYFQEVIQNTSNGSQASSEFIAYNDQGTATTNFAAFGINSSGYSGTGAINAPGNAYALSGSTDLVLGTIGSNSIHLVTNSSTTDAITITSANAVAFNGSYGTSGQVLTSAGSGAPPTWAAPATSQYLTYANQSANITLVASNANSYIDITPINDINLFLPAANTLSSSLNFTFKNSSNTYGIIVYDNANNYLFAIPPLTGITCWTTSTATAAGAWVTDRPPQDYLGTVKNTTLYASNSYPPVPGYGHISSPISSTQAIYTLSNGTVSSLFVVTNTSNVLSYGTPVVLPFLASDVCMLSATTGLVCNFLNSGGSASVIAFTVSGTTITLGSQTSIGFTGTYYRGSFAALSSTTATFTASGGTSLQGVVLTVSGTTITLGVINTSIATSVTGAMVWSSAFTSTLVGFVFQSNSSTASFATLSISGTGASATITYNGSPVNQTTSYFFNFNFIAVSSTTAFVSYNLNTSSTFTVNVATVSGTTLTLGTGVTTNTASFQSPSICAISSTKAVAGWETNSTTASSAIFTISGTTVTAGTAANLTLGNAPYFTDLCAFQTPAIATPSATNALFTYGYINANTYLSELVLNVSGSTPSYNTGYSYDATSTVYTGVVNHQYTALSATTFIVITYTYNSTLTPVLVANYCTFTNGTINVVSTATISSTVSSNTYYAGFSAVSSTQGVVTFIDNTGKLNAAVISVSGSVVSSGTPVVIDSTTTCRYSAITAINGTQLAAIWHRSSTSIQAAVLTISGTTVSAGTSVTFSTPTASYYVNAVAISSTSVVFSGLNNSSSSQYSYFTYTISGTTLTQTASSGIIGTLINASYFPSISVGNNSFCGICLNYVSGVGMQVCVNYNSKATILSTQQFYQLNLGATCQTNFSKGYILTDRAPIAFNTFIYNTYNTSYSGIGTSIGVAPFNIAAGNYGAVALQPATVGTTNAGVVVNFFNTGNYFIYYSVGAVN